MTRADFIQHCRANNYLVTIAAMNIGLLTPLDPVTYPAVATEITRMRENPIPAGVQDRRKIPLAVPKFERVSGNATSPIPDEPIPEWEDIV